MMGANTGRFNSVQLPTGASELDSDEGMRETRAARARPSGASTLASQRTHTLCPPRSQCPGHLVRRTTPGAMACDPLRRGAYFAIDGREAKGVACMEGGDRKRVPRVDVRGTTTSARSRGIEPEAPEHRRP